MPELLTFGDIGILMESKYCLTTLVSDKPGSGAMIFKDPIKCDNVT